MLSIDAFSPLSIIFMWSIHVLTYKNDLFFSIALWCALINFIKVNFTNNKMHLLLNIWLEFWNMYALTWPPTYWRHRTLTSPQKIILCYFIVWTTSPLHCMPHWSYFLPNLSFWNINLSMFLPGFQTFQSPIALMMKWNLLNGLLFSTWADVCLLSLISLFTVLLYKTI